LVVFYLIAYDIADDRRLRRVARVLERWAVRCQKSVFLYRGDADRVGRLLDRLAPLLDREADCVQAWRLSPDQPALGLVRGTAVPIRPGAAVLGRPQAHFVDRPQPRGG
jgi:CRISPR-associated protein Cas2